MTKMGSMEVNETLRRHDFMNCDILSHDIYIPNLYTGYEHLVVRSLIETDNRNVLEMVKIISKRNLLKTAYKLRFYLNKAKMKDIKITKKVKARLLKELQ